MVGIYLLVMIVAMVAVGYTVSSIVESFLVAQRTQDGIETTQRLAQEIAPLITAGDVDGIYDYALARSKSLNGRVLLLDTDAVVQIDSASRYNGYILPYREVRDVFVNGENTSFGFHRIEKGEENTIWNLNNQYSWAVYYVSPVTVGGSYLGVVLYSTLIQDVEDSVAAVIKEITLVFVIVILAAAAINFLFSIWLTKPITEMTKAIRQMGRKNRGVRVNIKGSSEIVELGAAFNRMSEQIEDHDRVRDEFVSNASHELKTPLATMKLLSESILYEEKPDPAVMKEFFEDVNHEVDRLTMVINDLLKLVKLDASQSEPDLKPIYFDTCVKEIAERLRLMAEKKGISMNINADAVVIRAEKLRLDQIVMNLIENAIKYTDKGCIEINVYQDNGDGVLEVSDSGVGIPVDAIPHLFERFYRVDKARSRETGGTGLGLAIVKKLVDLQGGSINVVSELGVGTTFTVRLPAEQEV